MRSGKSELLVVVNLLLLCLISSLSAGISKEIQNQYNQEYRNRALYLKVPVHGFQQTVFVGVEPRLDRSNLGQPVAFKVGDQVRITAIDYKDQFIRFRLSALDLGREAELIFRFSADLDNQFHQRDQFENALQYALTTGLSYKEIDSAKENYIADQFDELIDKFASTTGTSRQFVIETISAKNPEFEKSKNDLAAARQQLANVRSQVEQEKQRRQEAESALRSVRQQVADSEADSDSLKREKQALAAERDDLKSKLARLEKDGQNQRRQEAEYQKRIQDLVGRLDVESSEKTQLGSRLQSLDSALEELDRRSTAQVEKIKAQTDQIAELQKSKLELTQDLEKATRERDRNANDLKVLTSDKQGLNSRYLETKNERDLLRTAQQLQNRLSLQTMEAAGDSHRREVRLGDIPLGQLELIPSVEGYRIRLSVASPDTVKFSEEERQLWSALDEKLSVEPRWRSPRPETQPVLVGETARQVASPRQEVEWQWQVNDEHSGPVELDLLVFDKADNPVVLSAGELVIRPDGLTALLFQPFSLWSLLLGLAGGAALLWIAGRSRSQQSTRRPAVAATPSAAEKRF